MFYSKGYYEIISYYTSRDWTKTWEPIDYTTKCGKVWDQGGCVSCYAFSMVNTIECNYNLKTGILPQLSRQQIVDCNSLTGGCNGGYPPSVGYYAHSQNDA